MTHCNLLSTINSSFPTEIVLQKRCSKFIHSCLNSNNMIIQNAYIFAITTHNKKITGDNYRDIFYKYMISRNLWCLPISNTLHYVHDSIVKYICTLTEGSMIRELCLHNDLILYKNSN